MADKVALLLAGIQTTVVVVTAAFAWISIRKFRDSRGVDFVINAESTVDPLYHGLVHADPALIRNVYRTAFDLSGLSDEEVAAFPFMHALYRQVSRLCFMLTDDDLDLGLSSDARREMIDVWLASLARYKMHPAMQVIHETSISRGGYNKAFLGLAAQTMSVIEEDWPSTTVVASDPETAIPDQASSGA